MWAYTRNNRLNIVLTTSRKLQGNGAPVADNKLHFYKCSNQIARLSSLRDVTYPTFGGKLIHRLAELQSNPSDTLHISEQIPLLVSLL